LSCNNFEDAIRGALNVQTRSRIPKISRRDRREAQNVARGMQLVSRVQQQFRSRRG
jgi:hypothetical protein